jgi:hypothetical protein
MAARLALGKRITCGRGTPVRMVTKQLMVEESFSRLKYTAQNELTCNKTDRYELGGVRKLIDLASSPLKKEANNASYKKGDA